MSKYRHNDFLLEIGTEELPPKQIKALVLSLATNLEKELVAQALTYETIKTYATPRRLAVLITKLIVKQPDQDVEFRGPPVEIAFDQKGNPKIAATKFAQTCGVKVEKLKIVTDGKRKVLYYKTKRAGQLTESLLPEIMTNSIKKMPLQRPMRWGDGQTVFVRPVHWLVMMLGKKVISAEIFGVKSENKTFGHRFHCPTPLVISEPQAYEKTLAQKGHVIADLDKRRQKICKQIATKVKKGTAIINEELLAEITNLVEWPVVLMGSFNPGFLEMPSEV